MDVNDFEGVSVAKDGPKKICRYWTFGTCKWRYR